MANLCSTVKALSTKLVGGASPSNSTADAVQYMADNLKAANAGVLLSAVPDSDAKTIAALAKDFNGLLAALREAGIMASE